MTEAVLAAYREALAARSTCVNEFDQLYGSVLLSIS